MMHPPIVRNLNKIEKWISRWIKQWGQACALLSFGTMGLSCLIVLFRYFFNFGSIALQELVIYLHAITFLFCAAYTFQKDKHIRVDIFYQKCSPQTKAYINLIGTLCLLWPFLILITWSSWDYIFTSWRIKEGSSDAGGLPFVYLLKTAILGMVFLLTLQSFADIIKQLNVILKSEPCQ